MSILLADTLTRRVGVTVKSRLAQQSSHGASDELSNGDRH